MELSTRVQGLSESITLKLNATAVKLADEGNKIYNLSAGQLPFRPLNEFVNLIRTESDFLKSFQYSPVSGFPDLRKKIMKHIEEVREIDFSKCNEIFDCVISNGAKHSLSNILGCLLNQDDEVVLMAPYWVSYPEMIKFCKGVPKIVKTSPFEVFEPSIDLIRDQISPKTKAIIINSPNNPAGIHYSDKWMEEFGKLMLDYPNVTIISDEIYYELNYFDPKPKYYYQFFPQLLNQTVIVDGISKTLAATGLRIGYCIAPKKLTDMITKLQGQTTSGANSLIQRALVNFDFKMIEEYLVPIKRHLRENADTLREIFRQENLAHSWYQSNSAFYYLIDFSQAKAIKKYQKNEDDSTDYSVELAEALLKNHGIAVVPGAAFGMPNTARMSLVLEKDPFKEAVNLIVKFLNS